MTYDLSAYEIRPLKAKPAPALSFIWQGEVQIPQDGYKTPLTVAVGAIFSEHVALGVELQQRKKNRALSVFWARPCCGLLCFRASGSSMKSCRENHGSSFSTFSRLAPHHDARAQEATSGWIEGILTDQARLDPLSALLEARILTSFLAELKTPRGLQQMSHAECLSLLALRVRSRYRKAEAMA